jgi:hypothetical protein
MPRYSRHAHTHMSDPDDDPLMIVRSIALLLGGGQASSPMKPGLTSGSPHHCNTQGERARFSLLRFLSPERQPAPSV